MGAIMAGIATMTVTDLYDIEAAFYMSWVSNQVVLSAVNEFFLLAPIYRLCSPAVAGSAAAADLDKAQYGSCAGLLIARDDIDFTATAAIVALHYEQALSLQEIAGQVFSGGTALQVGMVNLSF